MSYVARLLEAYGSYVSLPWQHGLAPAQRVWMAIYPPEQERRLRLNLDEFKIATKQAGHEWGLVDVTTSFERWMAGHSYRERYLQAPHLLHSSLGSFAEVLAAEVRGGLEAHAAPDGVVGLLGVGALFGLGDEVKVARLIAAVTGAIAGRLLVFFPGEHEGNAYRLLDARDGWDYLAVPITSDGRR